MATEAAPVRNRRTPHRPIRSQGTASGWTCRKVRSSWERCLHRCPAASANRSARRSRVGPRRGRKACCGPCFSAQSMRRQGCSLTACRPPRDRHGPTFEAFAHEFHGERRRMNRPIQDGLPAEPCAAIATQGLCSAVAWRPTVYAGHCGSAGRLAQVAVLRPGAIALVKGEVGFCDPREIRILRRFLGHDLLPALPHRVQDLGRPAVKLYPSIRQFR